MTAPEISEQTRLEIEAAAFRRLLAHLAQRTDAQNIDLMGLAGFCRNCLANWYQEAAAGRAIPLDKMQARALIYGMDYNQWIEEYQTEAHPDQIEKMKESLKKNNPDPQVS